MLALRSMQGRMDGFQFKKYEYKMLRVTLYQFLDLSNYSHVIIA